MNKRSFKQILGSWLGLIPLALVLTLTTGCQTTGAILSGMGDGMKSKSDTKNCQISEYAPGYYQTSCR